jgi:hypothetical protein
LFRRFLGDFCAPLGRQVLGASGSPLVTERLRRRVVAAVNRQGRGFLACRDAHHFRGVADNVGGTTLALGAGGRLDSNYAYW